MESAMELWAVDLAYAPSDAPLLVVAAEDAEEAQRIAERLREAGALKLRPRADGEIQFGIRPASPGEEERWEDEVARAIADGAIADMQQAYEDHFATVLA